jgi:ADP-heptose:LPS heptosyltransferase
LILLRLIGIGYAGRVEAAARTKILLIRPDHVGDLLFLTPSLHYLRRLLPAAHLSLMVGPWGRAVVENNPHIDELLICEFPGFTRVHKDSVWQPYQYLYDQARLLRSHHFDRAVILRFDHWWGAWLAAAAGIPRRFGYAVPEVQPFLTDRLAYVPTRHEVEQNWHLMGAAGEDGEQPPHGSIGPTEFFIPTADHEWAEAWLTNHQISSEGCLIIIHPGAGAAVKFWRAEAWAELAQKLIDQYQCQVLFTGSAHEADLCHEIAARIQPRPPTAAGQTTLSQLAALLHRARLVVGSDTGPVKLAAAVGVPTLELYGPVDAQKFGPWGNPARQRYLTSALECLPCNRLDYSAFELPAHYCIRGLAVSGVFAEVARLLNQSV